MGSTVRCSGRGVAVVGTGMLGEVSTSSGSRRRCGPDGGEHPRAPPSGGMHDDTTPLQDLVAALVGIGGQLTTTLEHMETSRAAGRSAPGADDIPVVLAGLLCSVLREMPSRFSAGELRGAAAVLEDAARRIEDGLFLVG
jgi:hypothetical protein